MAEKRPPRPEYQRKWARTRRYGNWRQIFLSADGMCQGKLEDGGTCGETTNLEFHEEYDGCMVKSVTLLCPIHHQLRHIELGDTVTINPRAHRSCLQEDVQEEMEQCGGLEGWIRKYELV